MNGLTKLLIFLTTLILIYYRPLYSILILFLIFAEHYYAFSMLYYIKYNEGYLKYQISRPEYSSLNLIDLWLLTCKMNAFLKVYAFLSKKSKIKLSTILRLFFIIAFGVPVFLINLSIYFLKSKNNFRDTLLHFLHEIYFKSNKLKIEVLDNKIYLNTKIVKTIGEILIKNNPKISKSEFIEQMLQIQALTRQFSKQDSTFGLIEIKQAYIYDNEKTIYSKIPHFTMFEEDTTIHSTSNINFPLKSNQVTDNIISTLVKPAAENPGTIITRGVQDIKFHKKNGVFIPKIEADVIKINHKSFTVEAFVKDYLEQKDELIGNTLKNNFGFEEYAVKTITKSIKFNEYNLYNFNTMTLFEISEQYEKLINKKISENLN